jgi:ATP-dependent helicase/nuclease subunit A
MPYLNIIRASAGSGKTHFLTGAFLELLIKEPIDYFKGMLAVTFTNKATAEMKGRLVGELHKLAVNEKSDYLEKLKQITGFNEDHIRNKAYAILRNILHDYSWFSIETIDSFFQRIIRAFTRELAIPGNYTIEINTGPVLHYAVDQLIDGIEDNSILLNWLVSFSEARINEGRTWDIRRELIILGKEIFKEAFAIASNQVFEAISDKEKLNRFREHLYGITGFIEKHSEEFGKQGLEIINEFGFQDTDFYQGRNGVGTYFKKLSRKQVAIPNSYVLKMLDGPENWPSGKTAKKAEIEDAASKYLLPLLSESIQYVHENLIYYNTVNEILKNLYSAGILADISNKVTEYLHEKNSFLLSDSPLFIYKIIDRNETPFIYEKMGNRYLHFMIDEFQDTSGLQWQNFKPLINNSLSMGNDCLLVGDVKQSIYRWRNSNWEVLAGQVLNEFPDEILKLSALETNWRSQECIVDFINNVFPSLVEILQNQFNNKGVMENSSETIPLYSIENLYNDVRQQIPEKSRAKGKVLLQFFLKSSISGNPDYYKDPLIDNIDDMLLKGFSPGDIAILVRSKKEGQLISNFLIEQNAANRFCRDLIVISNESLLLGASEGINLITAAMRYLLTPDDAINRGKLIAGYLCLQSQIKNRTNIQDFDFKPGLSSITILNEMLPKAFTENLSSFISYPLYNLAEQLIRIFETDKLETEIPYLHAFLDLIHEYTRANPSDVGKFLDFWVEEGIDKSIPSSESQDALRILTIHKSKGLQFRAVIIPFCNWELDQKPRTILWSKAKSKDLNYLPIIPVNFGKNLLETEFADSYKNELFKSYVDNLNLLYVATSRAIENLVVFSTYRDPAKGEQTIKTVGDLLHETFTKSEMNGMQKLFDPNLDKFESGKIQKFATNDSSPNATEEYISVMEGRYNADKLFFDPSGSEYFRDTFENIKNPIIQGRVLHDILARVNSADDIDGATSDAVFKGLITEKEGQEFKVHFKDCLKNQDLFKWFNGSGEVLTETDIIITRGEVRRPDRVVIFSDHVDIIDYKSGQDAEREAHNVQVGEYVNLLLRMGYKNVKGYIWYINNNKIKVV